MKIKLFFACCVFFFLFSCQKEETKSNLKIAVFVPGVRAGSAIYDMLASGVERAVSEAKKDGKAIELTILEAGTNQGEWLQKLSNLASDEECDLIISSNPSLPTLAKDVLKKFPRNKFLLLDASSEGDERITTVKYNQYEQAYIAGHMAALVSLSDMKWAKNDKKKIGLIAGQEYPDMTNIILPSFMEGARAVDIDVEVDFRIIGNWYDAAKGAEVATSMYNEGVDVILPICGGANQGVITAAKENGFYVVWFDSNGYEKLEGYVVGSAVMEQERCAYEKTRSFIEGTLVEGKAEVLGIKEGYVDFIKDDPLYISTVPDALRAKQEDMLIKLKEGKISINEP